jgi:hypothetical protein
MPDRLVLIGVSTKDRDVPKGVKSTLAGDGSTSLRYRHWLSSDRL